MKTPSRKELCSLALAGLLFLPAMPVGAASATGGDLDLHLEEALNLQGAALLLEDTAAGEGLSSREEGPGDSRPAPELRRRSLEDVASQMSKEDQDPAQQPSSKRGFGRWMKKRWYVPVLAAIAIGVVVADSDDTDATGEED